MNSDHVKEPKKRGLPRRDRAEAGVKTLRTMLHKKFEDKKKRFSRKKPCVPGKKNIAGDKIGCSRGGTRDISGERNTPEANLQHDRLR